MPKFSKLAVVYLSFHPQAYLVRAIEAIATSSYPKEDFIFIIVDHPHPEFGSAAKYITSEILPLAEKLGVHLVFLPQEKNGGFAKGNNIGINWALERDFKYIYLHNQDGFVTPNTLETLVKALENDPKIGVVQSLMRLYPETELLNNLGNRFHYLGFGYGGDYRAPVAVIENTPAISEIGYASGASMVLRSDLLKRYGVWDEDFFMYHEDLEYSLRLRSIGYKIVLVKDAIFYHEYAFSRNPNKYYFMERNRYAIVLMYYTWPTLILLLPINIFLEIGLVVFAFTKGWLKEKIGAYGYWLKAKNWKLWLKKRRIIQKQRTVSDRIMLNMSMSVIQFDDKNIDNPILKYIANPILKVYGWVVKKLIFW